MRTKSPRVVTVHPSDGDLFAIDHLEKAGLPFGDLDAIDLAVTEALTQPDRWRANAQWDVSWDAVDRPDGTRQGRAARDGTVVEFSLRVVINGAVVLIVLRRDQEPAKWFRCETPFPRPNEYAVDQVIERAYLRWLPADGAWAR